MGYPEGVIRNGSALVFLVVKLNCFFCEAVGFKFVCKLWESFCIYSLDKGFECGEPIEPWVLVKELACKGVPSSVDPIADCNAVLVEVQAVDDGEEQFRR